MAHPSLRRPLRRMGARLLLLAAGLALGLGAAELAVRLLRPQPVMVVSRGLYRADPPRRYRLAPGFRGRLTNRVEFDTRVETDAAGLRGPEVGPTRPGVLRVLALGDSFTFGVGVEQPQAWPARLAAHLAAAGKPAEALNAGAPGFGVPDEVAWLAKWGLPLHPDVVAIAVFVGNDLQDAAPDVPKVEVVDGALVLQGEGKPSLGRWLYYHSHLFVLLKSGLPAGLGRRVRGALGRPEPWEVRELRLEFELYGEELPESLRAGAAATERAVGELARLARAKGFKPVALLIPSEPQVDPAAWRKVLARLGLDPAGYDPRRPTRRFERIFTRQGVPVLDLTRPLTDAVARGERVYYPIDKHLTAAGQDLVAQKAAAFLRSPAPEARGATTALQRASPRPGIGDRSPAGRAPQPAGGAAQSARGAPQPARGVPQPERGVSQLARGVPQSARGGPQLVGGAPQPARGAPQLERGAAQPAGGAP